MRSAAVPSRALLLLLLLLMRACETGLAAHQALFLLPSLPFPSSLLRAQWGWWSVSGVCATLAWAVAAADALEWGASISVPGFSLGAPPAGGGGDGASDSKRE